MPKGNSLQKEMIVCKLHQIFYTIENSMGAPKKEGTKGYFSVEKISTLSPSKRSHISLSTHINFKRTKLHDLRLFLLHSLFQLYNIVLSIAPELPNYPIISHHDYNEEEVEDPCSLPPPWNFIPTKENSVRLSYIFCRLIFYTSDCKYGGLYTLSVVCY